MAQFWNCLLNCLPHGQCTETSNFLTFCPHFHQLMRNKRVVSEEDPEIRPFSRESYYTSIQSPFLQHFFSFFLPVRYFFQYPFLPSPKADVTKADVTSPFSCAIWCSWHLEDEGSLVFDMASCPGKGKGIGASGRERITGGMRNVLLSQSGLSGAREWALQSTPVPLLLPWNRFAGSGGSHVCLPCCPSVHTLECSV